MQFNRSKIGLPIDESRPNGVYSVSVRYHPSRVARRLEGKSSSEFLRLVGELCQVWGGGQIPIIPTANHQVPAEYREAIMDSALDGVEDPPKVDSAFSGPGSFHYPSDNYNYLDQFVFSLFGYGDQEQWVPVEAPELEEADPWFEIYAACLGRLPEAPNRQLLGGNRLNLDLSFEDFLSIERPKVEGGIEDLVDRMCIPGKMLPRWMTLFQLSSLDQRREPLFPEPVVLPPPEHSRPMRRRLVIVVCSQSSEDLALLWNLVGASGGQRLQAIGLPASEFSWENVSKLIESANKHGSASPENEYFFTSSSLPPEELRMLLSVPESANQQLRFVVPSEVLSFGPTASQDRIDSVLFENGRGVVVPSMPGAFPEIYSKPLLNGSTQMRIKIEVDGWALPKNLRIIDHDAGIIDSELRSWASVDRRSSPIQVLMPSRFILLKAATARKDLTFRESEPGKAARLLIERMGGIREVAYLLHEPLLELLDEMASKQGINWFKQRVAAPEADSVGEQLVADDIDDLKDFAYEKFKGAFAQKAKSTKYWLFWAEKKGLITKGVNIYCGHCGAKEWVAINGLSLPKSCKGCGFQVETPFSDHTEMKFTYKMSELLRRVYRNDAMGHVIAAYFFSIVLGERKLIGWHPGLEFCPKGKQNVVGEVDVLLHTLKGQMIPVEVKRSAGGVTSSEVKKLDDMQARLGANWSVVAICAYANDVSSGVADDWIATHEDGSYKRMVLTYDRLLDPTPTWASQEDPFRMSHLSKADIKKREARFLDFVYNSSQNENRQPFFERLLLDSAEKDDPLSDI